MTKEELKDKYSAFITEISEILGLGKPVDIIKLCATTDLFFQPLQKQIAELEKENEVLKGQMSLHEGLLWNDLHKLEQENAELEKENVRLNRLSDMQNEAVVDLTKTCKQRRGQVTKAKELLNEFMRISKASDEDFEHDYSELIGEAEQFLKEIKE